MIVAPPFDVGAVHDTDAEAFPAVAATPVGALGTVMVVVLWNSNSPAVYPPEGENPDVVTLGAPDPAACR